MKKTYDFVAVENFLWTPHIQTSLEILIKNKAKRKAFIFLNIDNPDNPDIPNNRFKIFGKKRIEKKLKKILKKKRIDYIEISKENIISHNALNKKFKISNFSDLSKLKMKGCNIGFGIASSLVDRLKKRDPSLIDCKKNILDLYIKTTIQVFLAMEELFRIYNFKKILTFNGRFAHSAVIKNFCYKKKIDIFFHERSDNKNRYYLNSRPVHDMQAWRKMAINSWKTSKLSLKKKQSIGKKWFEDRQKNKFADGLNHTKFQVRGKIPNFSQNKRIITFFSHSDEEYAYCQELKHPIFSNQRETIIWLINYFKNKKNTIFVLRIHPNLLNKSKTDIKWWHNLKKKYNHKNFMLIGSKSECDSYALIKKSHITLTFCSSSIALESTYLGAPSIVIGDSQYRSTQSAHHPKSIKDLKNLITKKNIKPKPKNNALKFAFFRATYGNKYKFYKPKNNFEGKIFNEKFNYYPEFLLQIKKLLT